MKKQLIEIENMNSEELKKLFYNVFLELLPELKKALRPDEDSLLTINQAAKILGLSRQTIYNYYHNNVPPFCTPIRLGKRILFKKSSILDYLDKNI